MTFLEPLPVGLLIALISAGVLRRQAGRRIACRFRDVHQLRPVSRPHAPIDGPLARDQPGPSLGKPPPRSGLGGA